MAKQGISVKRTAELLGVSPRWVRARIAEGAISPKRAAGGRSGRYAVTDADVAVLRGLAAAPAAVPSEPAAGAPQSADGPQPAGAQSPETPVTADALARIGKLEAERANLLARLAWEHATAEAQGKALDEERRRVDALTAEVAAQRTRVEQLKALSAWDRVIGRHKAI